MDSKENSRIVVTLEKRQRKALEKIQKDTGASFAFLIRRAIDKYLDGIKK
jgi:predicted DNA-binding protein